MFCEFISFSSRITQLGSSYVQLTSFRLNWALLASFIVQLCSIVLYCTQLCSIVLNCCQLCSSVHTCAQLCSTVHNCTQLRSIVLNCPQLCSTVHNCAQLCSSVLKCAQLGWMLLNLAFLRIWWAWTTTTTTKVFSWSASLCERLKMFPFLLIFCQSYLWSRFCNVRVEAQIGSLCIESYKLQIRLLLLFMQYLARFYCLSVSFSYLSHEFADLYDE